jgi:membrane-associated phospholipid phosphatase
MRCGDSRWGSEYNHPMRKLFYRVFYSIADLYQGRNLLWQFFFVILTYILVATGFDWFYYQSTQGLTVQSILFPAAIFGFLIPVLAPIAMFAAAALTRNKRLTNAAYAISQAGLLGLGVSSLYKVFTGRVGLPHLLSGIDTSVIFRFGVLRGGAFQGWPSSHTSVAFAMSMALVTLYPENRLLRFLAIAYAIYIGLGVSGTIHWFSDFAAGAILGTIIGVTVGGRFLARYNEAR